MDPEQRIFMETGRNERILLSQAKSYMHTTKHRIWSQVGCLISEGWIRFADCLNSLLASLRFDGRLDGAGRCRLQARAGDLIACVSKQGLTNVLLLCLFVSFFLSFCPSVGPSLRRSVCLALSFFQSLKIVLLQRFNLKYFI